MVEEENSFRFLGVVRLVLYMKKNLRPILGKYLEEPNTFFTWSTIYYEVKPILDDLINSNAITEYTWNGDQNATSYNDLQVNSEADVRQGKYKAQLKFKEIIGMQEITIDLILDSSTNTLEM